MKLAIFIVGIVIVVLMLWVLRNLFQRQQDEAKRILAKAATAMLGKKKNVKSCDVAEEYPNDLITQYRLCHGPPVLASFTDLHCDNAV